MLTRSLIAILIAAPMAAPAAHPDFSGTWVLDATKTTVSGMLSAPSAATNVVVQRGDSLHVEQKWATDRGELAMHKDWRVDGKAWINHRTEAGMDLTLSSVLSWSDAVLTIRTTIDFQGTPILELETWTLDGAAKTLTAHTTVTANGEEFGAMTLVFARK
jgi:hypothetical protein